MLRARPLVLAFEDALARSTPIDEAAHRGTSKPCWRRPAWSACFRRWLGASAELPGKPLLERFEKVDAST